MALKATITEQCPRCKKRAAHIRGNHIAVSHFCDDPIPGPPSPAYQVRFDSVVFVSGDFTKEQLEQELKEEFARNYELSEKLSKYKRRLDDVFVAMKNYTTNRVG